jgi:hypothetical protein
VPDRSLIFNAKGIQIGYIEGHSVFDLTGRERCKYARATGNLFELNGEKIVGYWRSMAHSLAYPGYLMSYLESQAVRFIRTAFARQSSGPIIVR